MSILLSQDLSPFLLWRDIEDQIQNDNMATEQSAEFKTAVEDSRKLKAKPNNDELLQLYAHFKQGTQSPSIDAAPKPGTFDLAGKAKYKAWQKLVDEGVTPEQAQEKYIALVKSLAEKYGKNE